MFDDIELKCFYSFFSVHKWGVYAVYNGSWFIVTSLFENNWLNGNWAFLCFVVFAYVPTLKWFGEWINEARMLPWVRKRATQLEANKQHTCIWIAYKTLYSRCFFFFLGIKVLCFQGSLTNAQGFSAPKAFPGIHPPPSLMYNPPLGWDILQWDQAWPGTNLIVWT